MVCGKLRAAQPACVEGVKQGLLLLLGVAQPPASVGFENHFVGFIHIGHSNEIYDGYECAGAIAYQWRLKPRLQFKNKLGETKSWASSATAKTNQARLICLTHNLMTLMEEMIRERTGVFNRAEMKRKNEIRENRIDAQKKRAGTDVIPHINHAAERLTQRTVKFIRWLKNHLSLDREWDDAIAKLSRIYQHS